MTLYTYTLCNHETILNKPIKTNTIELYHKAAISFPKTFNEITATTHKTIWNPLKDVNGKKPQTITDLLQEHKLWEDEISKRKPVTEEMFNYIQSLVNQQKPCSLISALADWATIARQAGLRLSEYCQDSRTIKPGNYALNVYGEAKAFTINDFIFVGHNNENLNPSHTDRLDISRIGGAYIRWRTQKNGTKNETLPYAINNKDKTRCVVRAMLRIRLRAQHLNILPTEPLAVAAYNNVPFFIQDTHVNGLLRDAAAKVHNVTTADELKLYSTHSYRVMACVLLYNAGKSTEFIKNRLRWKSEAFKMYLRHLPTLAKQHNEATEGKSFLF